MKTSQGENKFFHPASMSANNIAHKSLPVNNLKTGIKSSSYEIARQSVLSLWKQRRYNRQKAIMALIDPVTFQSKIGEMKMDNRVHSPLHSVAKFYPNKGQSGSIYMFSKSVGLCPILNPRNPWFHFFILAWLREVIFLNRWHFPVENTLLQGLALSAVDFV